MARGLRKLAAGLAALALGTLVVGVLAAGAAERYLVSGNDDVLVLMDGERPVQADGSRRVTLVFLSREPATIAGVAEVAVYTLVSEVDCRQGRYRLIETRYFDAAMQPLATQALGGEGGRLAPDDLYRKAACEAPERDALAPDADPGRLRQMAFRLPDAAVAAQANQAAARFGPRERRVLLRGEDSVVLILADMERTAEGGAGWLQVVYRDPARHGGAAVRTIRLETACAAPRGRILNAWQGDETLKVAGAPAGAGAWDGFESSPMTAAAQPYLCGRKAFAAGEPVFPGDLGDVRKLMFPPPPLKRGPTPDLKGQLTLPSAQ